MTLRDAGVQLIDCVHKTPAPQETGYPYIGIPQMKSGRIDFETARKISLDDFLEWTKKARPQRHDVILSRRTNPGVTATDGTGTEFALGQNLVLLRSDGGRVEPAFLKWLVRSPAWWREIRKFINVGAVFDSLRCADIPDFELPIPPRPHQLGVVELLDSIDDKIELNRRMNNTLEAMARALFKSWFVDFEPVRAKMAGRDTGLPQSVSHLFPARIEHAESKDVPLGWRPYSVGELAEHHTASVAPGATPSTLFEHFSIPAHDAGGTPRLELGSDIKSNKTLVPHGAVLLSKLNPEVHRVWLPHPPSNVPQICSTEFLAFTPLPPASSTILYSLFCDQAFRTVLCSLVTGTSKSHQRVPPKGLKSQLVISGAPPVFRLFDKLVTPWLSRMIANREQSLVLAKLRDVLLPKLISGEIRVADAERAVAAVL